MSQVSVERLSELKIRLVTTVYAYTGPHLPPPDRD
jgi:hypothetical protein